MWLPDFVQSLLGAGGVAMVGGYVQLYIALRNSRRADGQSLSQTRDQLFQQLQAELVRGAKQRADYAAELDRMRGVWSELDEMMGGVRDAALAARMMVHDYERRLGLAETVFPALPRLNLPARAPPAA